MQSTEWFVYMYVCYQPFSKTTGPICMKFSGMICHHPRINRLDFGSNQVEGQGQGYKKVKNYWTELHEKLGMICHHTRTNRLDFGSDQVKGQGQGHKKVKTYFCHNMLSFRPIHMKPTPKCSLFNSLSSNMVTHVALAKICALPSARSNLYSETWLMTKKVQTHATI